MITSHHFNTEEIELMNLYKKSRRLARAMVVCFLVAGLSLCASVILMPRVTEATILLLMAIPFALIGGVCLVTSSTKKDKLRQKRESQRRDFLSEYRNYYRKKCPDIMRQKLEVQDHWNGNRHVYGVADSDTGVVMQWVDPLRPRARKTRNIKR